MTKNLRYHLYCPWCSSGETLADTRAKVTISVMCPKCGHAYLADLDTLETEKARPQRRERRRNTQR